MTDAQILKKAIERAIANGADAELFDGIDYDPWVTNTTLHTNLAYGIIFSHDFCRAFFGVDYTKDYYDTTPETGWAWHLQQMVLEPEPIKYLEQFLKG